ncbi:hemin uptake protein HemP [Thalassoglobus sp. JC818]|uniref:hemin uptake protein HemP n=1 Tax=Thalassoglobus sp. JC818 TaxID=3232136 RepID=UPI003457AEC8
MNSSPNDSARPENDHRDDPPRGDYESSELFAGREEITIKHNGQTYRLRQTKTGKLILNK